MVFDDYTLLFSNFSTYITHLYCCSFYYTSNRHLLDTFPATHNKGENLLVGSDKGNQILPNSTLVLSYIFSIHGYGFF